MSAIIHQLIKQAYKTFAKPDHFSTNFSKLNILLNELRAKDIALEEVLSTFLPRSYGAPVGYMAIHQCQHFNMCVFIVREKCSIPLHDHPGMIGLIKVIHGMAKITSYDSLETSEGCARPSLIKSKYRRRLEPIKCLLSGQQIVKDIDSAQILQHDKKNFHSIEAISGPTAFIDILAPPYNAAENRDCHYYIPIKDIPSSEQTTDQRADIEKDDKICYLQEIAPPRSFYCDSVAYQGPRIIVKDLNIDE